MLTVAASHEEACHKLEEQAQLIARLASDNANLISQVQFFLCSYFPLIE